MVVEIPIKPRGRWEVVFKDDNAWQCGIYVPENTSLNDVKFLEKHDAPELFYLIEGSIVLVLSPDGEKVIEVPMEGGKLYIVTEWHNAYRPNGSPGTALVIERVGIKTEYIKLRG